MIALRNPFVKISRPAELKGYVTDADAENAYLRALQAFRGLSPGMPDFIQYNRAAIGKAFYDSARASYTLYGIVTRLAASVAYAMGYAKLYNGNKVVENDNSITLLNNPNDLEDRGEFAEAWAINQLLFGEAFVYLENGVGLSAGRASTMYVMPSEQVELITGKNPIIKDVQFSCAGYKDKMPIDNVIWTRKYNPDPRTMHGLSPVAVAAKLVQLLNTADRRQLAGLENGGGGRLITPKPGQEGMTTPIQRTELTKESNDIKNANKTRVIGTAVEVHEMGDRPVDIAADLTSTNAVKALCFVYNLPYSLYESNTTFNNQKEAEKIMLRATGVPLAQMFLNKYAKRVLQKGSKLQWLIDQDSIPELRGEPQDVAAAYKLANRSYNELGALFGFDPNPEPWASQPIFSMSEAPGVPYMPNLDDLSE